MDRRPAPTNDEPFITVVSWILREKLKKKKQTHDDDVFFFLYIVYYSRFFQQTKMNHSYNNVNCNP